MTELQALGGRIGESDEEAFKAVVALMPEVVAIAAQYAPADKSVIADDLTDVVRQAVGEVDGATDGDPVRQRWPANRSCGKPCGWGSYRRTIRTSSAAHRRCTDSEPPCCGRSWSGGGRCERWIRRMSATRPSPSGSPIALTSPFSGSEPRRPTSSGSSICAGLCVGRRATSVDSSGAIT